MIPSVDQLVIHLRLQFSHLNKHKFRHDFGDTINAICVHTEVKLKPLNTFSCVAKFRKLELFENLKKVCSSFLNLNVKDKVSFLLYVSQTATSKRFSHDILKLISNYIKETGRFDRPLLCPNQWFLVFYCFIFFELFILI